MPWARKSVMEDFIQHPVERMRAGPKHGCPRTKNIRMERWTLSPEEKCTKSGWTTGACSAEKEAFTAWTFGRAQNRRRSGRERVLRQTAWNRLPSRTRWSNRGIRLGLLALWRLILMGSKMRTLHTKRENKWRIVLILYESIHRLTYDCDSFSSFLSKEIIFKEKIYISFFLRRT